MRYLTVLCLLAVFATPALAEEKVVYHGLPGDPDFVEEYIDTETGIHRFVVPLDIRMDVSPAVRARDIQAALLLVEQHIKAAKDLPSLREALKQRRELRAELGKVIEQIATR